jgi:hypothetical protein
MRLEDIFITIIIKSMKHNMRGAVSKRFPVAELHVVAAILDPSQRNLTAVQEYLTQNAVTAFDVLHRNIVKYVGDSDASDSSAASSQTTGGNEDYVSPWKRAKRDLLSKHFLSNLTLELEIQQYRCLSIDTVDDVLSWRSSQQQTFERLSKLALVVFEVSATSAPSERLISINGKNPGFLQGCKSQCSHTSKTANIKSSYAPHTRLTYSKGL